MAIRLIDICGFILFVILSNMLCVLIVAHIVWRCKGNKPIIALPCIPLIGNTADEMNKKRFKRILEDGSSEV